MLADAGNKKVPGWGGGYLFGIGGPSSLADRRRGWVGRSCRRSHTLSHTRLRGIFMKKKIAHFLEIF